MKNYDLADIIQLLENKQKSKNKENNNKEDHNKENNREQVKNENNNCQHDNTSEDNKLEKKSTSANLNFVDVQNIERLEEIDQLKSKVLKYIFYKKRTEQEIKNKFSRDYDKELLEEVIDNLKTLGYIDDNNYIERAVNEFTSINNLSIREIKYKLMSKGIKSNTIEDYFSKNYYELVEFEKKSAKNIVAKKSATMEKLDIKRYLMKKGYKEESIKEAL